jgi:hypothetical protein
MQRCVKISKQSVKNFRRYRNLYKRTFTFFLYRRRCPTNIVSASNGGIKRFVIVGKFCEDQLDVRVLRELNWFEFFNVRTGGACSYHCTFGAKFKGDGTAV